MGSAFIFLRLLKPARICIQVTVLSAQVNSLNQSAKGPRTSVRKYCFRWEL